LTQAAPTYDTRCVNNDDECQAVCANNATLSKCETQPNYWGCEEEAEVEMVTDAFAVTVVAIVIALLIAAIVVGFIRYRKTRG
jgi:hypothetical protein